MTCFPKHKSQKSVYYYLQFILSNFVSSLGTCDFKMLYSFLSHWTFTSFYNSMRKGRKNVGLYTAISQTTWMNLMLNKMFLLLQVILKHVFTGPVFDTCFVWYSFMTHMMSSKMSSRTENVAVEVVNVAFIPQSCENIVSKGRWNDSDLK